MTAYLPQQAAFVAAGRLLERYDDQFRPFLEAQLDTVVDGAYNVAAEEISGITDNLASEHSASRSLITDSEQYEQLGQQLLATIFEAVEARQLAKQLVELVQPTAKQHHRLFVLSIIEKLRRPALTIPQAVALARYTDDKLEDGEGAFADASPLVRLIYQLYLFLGVRINDPQFSLDLAFSLASHPAALTAQERGYDSVGRVM